MTNVRVYMESVQQMCSELKNTAIGRGFKISAPSTYKLKRLIYGCFVSVLFVYIFCVIGYIIPTVSPSVTPITALDFRCGNDVPVTHDATKNQLLTFYGHKELLNNPDVFRPSERLLTPLDFNFSLNSPDACHLGSKPTVVIMVLTQHEHLLERTAIRETWGSVAKNKPWPGRRLHGEVRMIFLLGKSTNSTLNSRVRDEAKVTKDIVQADFQESYYNLTLKVLMGFKWVKTFCPETQFVMKIDEDTFIDVPRILNLLVSLEWSNTIYGPFAFAERVVRGNKGSKASKTAVRMSAYPLDWYPPHVKGNMYIMPSDLAIKILNVSQYFPYMNIEDSHITGVLAKVFDARHVDIPEEFYDKHPTKDLNLCDFVLERKIMTQGTYPALAYSFWHRIQNTQLCGIISVENILKDFSRQKEIVQNMFLKRQFRNKETFTVKDVLTEVQKNSNQTIEGVSAWRSV
ncbi:beta-1,3-galactosyltransferase 5 isoform X2 [Patella vulgata]|uniref:beta-1,3-galactosyltransferase 5 isoform X2 n=1 Tax=Patella vulgata TaxID=6465 RepID=UPI0021803169|nr:beta-1,3-galactosyltransferase 5 isoform X2 [Patella vulgata]